VNDHQVYHDQRDGDAWKLREEHHLGSDVA
jgi:hypothetical protein